MKDKLTKKQKHLFEIICTYIDENKIAPTIRELMDMVGIKSTSTMHSYLARLKEKGYITWKDCSRRTIQIIKRDPREDYSQALINFDKVLALLDKEEELLKAYFANMKEYAELMKSLQYK